MQALLLSTHLLLLLLLSTHCLVLLLLSTHFLLLLLALLAEVQLTPAGQLREAERASWQLQLAEPVPVRDVLLLFLWRPHPAGYISVSGLLQLGTSTPIWLQSQSDHMGVLQEPYSERLVIELQLQPQPHELKQNLKQEHTHAVLQARIL